METDPMESKRAVLITGHYFQSKRRAGFHWLAKALLGRGWEVLFFTAPFSALSILKGDYRLASIGSFESRRLRELRSGLWSYVWFTPWHPANLRSKLLNTLSSPLFRRYGRHYNGAALAWLTNADLIIFESNPTIMLLDLVKQVNPGAKLVYRASDDLELLKVHPVVLEAQARNVANFDLISTPSRYLYNKFASLPSARLHHHGLQKQAFDLPHNSPYPPGNHFLFVGTSYFDYHFLYTASKARPDITFHIIGPLQEMVRANNIRYYGELPFRDTVPYILHARAGLHTLVYALGAESFTDSLKVLQYTYCRLPIIAPTFLENGRPNMCYYVPGDDQSIAVALAAALAYCPSSDPSLNVHSWDEVLTMLLSDPAISLDSSDHGPSPI